tara:strand:+ start:467 stop:754 length:288 start_codon:yes stop_codon:yes gene_type:complete
MIKYQYNLTIKTMRDQASIGKENPEIKYDRALDLFTESVMEPNHKLRGCAHNQGCYDELMEIREHVLDYLRTMRNQKVMDAKTMQFMRDNIPSRY